MPYRYGQRTRASRSHSFASLSLLLVGLTALFSAAGSRRFVEALTIVGVVLALVGIVQKPLFTGAIYGFWQLDLGRQPFGPFVNKNHFAGWMVMALPLTLALLVAGIARSMSKIKPGLRHKVLWLSSAEANRLMLIGVAAGVMALALMLTMSRSGIAAFVVSILITGWFVVRTLDRPLPENRRGCVPRAAVDSCRAVDRADCHRQPICVGRLGRIQQPPGRLGRRVERRAGLSAGRHGREHLLGGVALLPAPRARLVLRAGPQRLPAGRCGRRAAPGRFQR